jgi:transposase InsO family protein
LEVSASGYYAWRCREPSARQMHDADLKRRIAAVHRRSRGNYGAPRIVAELRAAGTPISKRRCARLMREMRLRGRKRQRRRPRTTDSSHGKTVPANLLAERPQPTGPDEVWVSDITYIKTGEGWCYLAVIMDLWSRMIVGWAVALTLHAGLAIAALYRALACRKPRPGLMHHSDRGSQYADGDYQEILAEHHIARSMSRAGNCYDNAAAESFFSTFKTESGIEESIPPDHRDVELASFDYIETFYNRTRRHSSLGYLSPVAFENQRFEHDTKTA